jgi:PIN domain nuclease of toxin-antitoxin system
MISDRTSLTVQDHKDPFDHIIIAQAISHKMTLVSSDTKFPFYRKQGLRLIENY